MEYTVIEEKYIKFNTQNTAVGSALRTLKGSWIRRDFKCNLGKRMSTKLYFHKSYAETIFKNDLDALCIFLCAESLVSHTYNIVRWDSQLRIVALEECPDFDIAREPVVGFVSKFNSDGLIEEPKKFNHILHHKWTMVNNYYAGFDVKESWEWSKKWLSNLREKANGTSSEAWLKQLEKFHLL